MSIQSSLEKTYQNDDLFEFSNELETGSSEEQFLHS